MTLFRLRYSRAKVERSITFASKDLVAGMEFADLWANSVQASELHLTTLPPSKVLAAPWERRRKP